MQNCIECSKIHHLLSIAKCILKNCMRVTGITFLLDHNSSSKVTKHDNDLIDPLASSSPSIGAAIAEENDVSLDTASNLCEVWIEPDSTVTKSQSLCARRRIEGSTFVIGRRRPTVSYMSVNPPDLYVSQTEPYSLSKRHCMIKINNDHVYIKDLNSRLGTIINGRRFGNLINGVSVMKLRSGENSLTLGRRSDNIKFRVIVNK